MKLIFLIFILVQALASTSLAARPQCEFLFKNEKILSKGRAYALGDRNNLISFGLEVEFNPDTTHPEILNDYRSEVISEVEWKKISIEQRMQMAKPQKQREPKRLNLTRMSTAPSWMPKTLTQEAYEATGRSMVFKSFNDLQKTLRQIERRYGRGAAQVHVVFSRDPELMGTAGFIAFSGALAQLKNLEKGYAKYLDDESKIPGKNFEHGDLAPIDNVLVSLTQKSEKSIFFGEHERWVLAQKFYLSTVLRAQGIYGDWEHLGFELRQFNYDYDGLLNETYRVTEVLEKGLIQSFRPFYKFYREKIEDYIALDSQNQIMWSEYLSTASPVDRSLLFGFRDWTNHPILLRYPLKIRIEKRAEIMRDQLELYRSFTYILNQKFTADERRKQMRIATAKFAWQIHLSSLFEDFYQELLAN